MPSIVKAKHFLQAARASIVGQGVELMQQQILPLDISQSDKTMIAQCLLLDTHNIRQYSRSDFAGQLI